MWAGGRQSLLSLSTPGRQFYQRGYVLRKLNKLPARDVYIVDSNLVIGYLDDDVVNWRRWASRQIGMGKKLFYLNMITPLIKEVPMGFEELRWQQESHSSQQSVLDDVYSEIEAALDIRGHKVSKLKTCVQMICLAGHAARAAGIDNGIAPGLGNVVFATTNYQAVRRVLGNEEKVAVVKKILEKYGLAPLVQVRLITREGVWRDIRCNETGKGRPSHSGASSGFITSTVPLATMCSRFSI